MKIAAVHVLAWAATGIFLAVAAPPRPPETR